MRRELPRMGFFDRFSRAKKTAPPPPAPPVAPSLPAPSLPARAKIASYDIADAVGLLELANGDRVRFGRSACKGFEPVVGASVILEEVAASPRGWRAKSIDLGPSDDRYDALIAARDPATGLPGRTLGSAEAAATVRQLAVITILLKEPLPEGSLAILDSRGLDAHVRRAKRARPRGPRHAERIDGLRSWPFLHRVGHGPAGGWTVVVPAEELVQMLGDLEGPKCRPFAAWLYVGITDRNGQKVYATFGMDAFGLPDVLVPVDADDPFNRSRRHEAVLFAWYRMVRETRVASALRVVSVARRRHCHGPAMAAREGSAVSSPFATACLPRAQ